MSMVSMNDSLDQTQDYKGRIFLGRVTNDLDPTGQKRFKVSIPGLFEDGELPWIGFAKDSPFGIGKGFGSYGVPAPGSTALVEFQDGDINYGICKGFVVTASDVDPEFGGRKWGWRDPGGSKLVVDYEEGNYEFTHQSGTKYLIDASGNLVAEAVGNVNITVNGNTSLTCGGQVYIKAASAIIEAALTTVKGALTVEGVLTFMSGLFGRGASGGKAMTIVGDFAHSGGTITSNDVGLHTHIHPTPEGDSGPPITGT